MQQKKDNEPKDISMKLKQIAKIILLMISFRIVMDSHMWVVLGFLILVIIYVLPAYLLKHLKSGLLQAMLTNAISKAQGFTHTWYAQNVSDHEDDKPKEPSKIHFVVESEQDIDSEHSDDTSEVDIVDTASGLWFQEDSHHTIWNNEEDEQ